jgi:hypothetical protein
VRCEIRCKLQLSQVVVSMDENAGGNQAGIQPVSVREFVLKLA